MNEAETRAEHIDPALKAAGWGLSAGAGLAEKGFGMEQLAEMQRIIDAEKSDIYGVLAHVASALTREAAMRVQRLRSSESTRNSSDFLIEVPDVYVSDAAGVFDWLAR